MKEKGLVVDTLRRVSLGIALLIIIGVAEAQPLEECGSLENAFGPFDYRTTPKDVKQLVEEKHFTANVESLTAGASGPIAGDIDYTLRVFPNHARALMAMSRLAERQKLEKPKGAGFTMECYFDRAIRFQPGDLEVRAVYGYHLLRRGDRRGAIRELELAQSAGGAGEANIRYNLGLAYFDLGDLDRALAEARRAYLLGFPLPGLRDKLKRANRWSEP